MFKHLKSQKGQTAVEYLLVVSVLALAIGVLFGGPRMQDAFTTFFKNMSSRITSPGRVSK
ncbi:MAG: hypothetical protein ABIE74_04910 [Pseudomonadota bacterium]